MGKSVSRRVERDVKEGYLILGFAAPDYNGPDRYAMSVLVEALGRGVNPLLAAYLHSQRDSVQNVSMSYLALRYGGAAVVAIKAAPRDLAAVERLAVTFLKQVHTASFSKKDFLNPEEERAAFDYLEMAKNQIRFAAGQAEESGLQLAGSFVRLHAPQHPGESGRLPRGDRAGRFERPSQGRDPLPRPERKRRRLRRAPPGEEEMSAAVRRKGLAAVRAAGRSGRRRRFGPSRPDGGFRPGPGGMPRSSSICPRAFPASTRKTTPLRPPSSGSSSRGGRSAVPAGLDGLAAMSTRLLLEIPDEGKVQDLMAQATRLSYICLEDCSVILVECLTENLEEALRVAAKIVRDPLITGIRIGRAKDLMTANWKTEDDDAVTAARSAVFRSFFGGTGYGSALYGSEASLKAIDKKSILAFVRRHVAGPNVFFCVETDLDREPGPPPSRDLLWRLPRGRGGRPTAPGAGPAGRP